MKTSYSNNNIFRLHTTIRKIYYESFLLIIFFSVSIWVGLLIFGERINVLVWIVGIILSIILVIIIFLLIILITLINFKRYAIKLLKPPYYVAKIKMGIQDNIIDIYKKESYICTIRIRNLASSIPSIVVPLNTPLTFFDISNRRIIGDGDKIIWVRLPKTITDIHTEFEDGKNYLVINMDLDLLKEKDDILKLTEYIKNEIESMKYSDKHLKKIHEEALAYRKFMRGYICTKCWQLIPKSKLKENCPVDRNPHQTRQVLLDIHPPYNAANSNIVYFQVVVLVFLIALEMRFFGYYLSDAVMLLLIMLEGFVYLFLISWYFHNVITFKNMLKHFEVKRGYIMEKSLKKGK